MPHLRIRHLMMLLALLVAVGLAAVPQPRAAFACSCAAPPAPRAARDGAAAVFAGTVSGLVQTGSGGERLLVTFDLEESWKGPTGPQLTVVTSSSSASCGYEFTRSEQYLVYADAQGSQMHVSLCSRTAPLADAGADLAELGPGTPVATGAAPVSSVTMGIPWVPLALGGVGGALLLLMLVGWLRRK